MSGHAPPALSARELTVRRGDAVIVSEFEWSHRPSSIAWLVGPNGAGKSSLLRVLAGLVEPHAGRVLRSGDAGRDAVGYYHPSMSLPPEPRAASFARLARALAPGPQRLAPDRALAAKRCSSLSTGEEKRLLLGPILSRARAFLFLDEPYEHLSREARVALTDALRTLAAERIIVVATNQPLPPGEAGPVITLSLAEEAHVE